MKIHQNASFAGGCISRSLTYFDDVAAKVWPWVNATVWVVSAERIGRVTEIAANGSYGIVLSGDVVVKLSVTLDDLRSPDRAWRRR